MNNKKICFITCVNDDELYEECLIYINNLNIPKGYEIDTISIKEADSIANAYNEAINNTDAKYKIYLHQDVYIINKNFIYDIINLFEENSEIGMIGVIGSKTIPKSGVWWDSNLKSGQVYDSHTGKIELLKFGNITKDFENVKAIDGLIMITQYDIPWKEELFDGWHFYDISHSLDYIREGFKVVVPKQDDCWCIHDCGLVDISNGYEKYKEIFLQEYDKDIKIPSYEQIYDIDNMKIKPKFNLNWYNEKDYYSDGDVEDFIIDCIVNNEQENYSNVIYNNFSWPTYYHLSHLRKNLLNWYPFNEKSSVLEIGCGMGAFTNLLCEKCRKVTSVEISKRRAMATLLRCRDKENLEVIAGNLNDIEFTEKFDYITLIGVLEYQGKYTNSSNPYQDFLIKIKSLLKPDGKLLIAIENKYGLKYWCGAREDHTGVPFDGINQYTLGNSQGKTFSKKELDNLLISSGFHSNYFYYPMPDYKLPTVVYSQDYLPTNGNMENMNRYYTDTRTIIADERKIYDDLINNNVFEFFSNSFLVECCETDLNMGEVLFAASSSERKPEYRVMTTINRNNKVIKKALCFKKGVGHIQKTMQNMNYLTSRDIKVISFYEENGIVTERSKKPTLESKILDAYRREDIPEIWGFYDLILSEINKSSVEAKPTDNVLLELKLDDSLDFGRILRIGCIDMIARNCFYEEGDVIWFDQEWIMENVPSSFILYRNLIEIYSSYSWLSDVISLNEIASRYGIIDLWDCYNKLNMKFSDKVMDLEHLRSSAVVRNIPIDTYVENIRKLL